MGNPRVVEGVESRVLSSYLLFISQRTVVLHLRIFETTLLAVEDTQVVDGFKCGRVFRSQHQQTLFFVYSVSIHSHSQGGTGIKIPAPGSVS